MDQTDTYQTNEYKADDLLGKSHGLESGGKRGKRPSRIGNESSGQGGQAYQGKSYADMSAEEVQQMMCDRVAKAVALAAGVVEGFATQMKESQVTENTELAIESIGKTATTIVRTTREQVNETKSAFLGDEGSSGFGGGTFGSSGTDSGIHADSGFGDDSSLKSGNPSF